MAKAKEVPEETTDTGEVSQDSAQKEEQVSSTETEQAGEAETTPTPPEEEQPAEDKGEEEKLLAGKFKTPDDLEKGYSELEKKLGGYKEVEEKARAYDQLSQAPRVSEPPPPPNVQQFVDAEGNLDVNSYQKAVDNYNSWVSYQTTENSRKAAQEEIDKYRIEQEFPEVKTDDTFAKSIVSMYRAGLAGTLYDAAKEIDKLRKTEVDRGKKEGAVLKEREIASKIHSQTERATGKTMGAITEADFSKLSLEEKRAYVNKLVADQQGR